MKLQKTKTISIINYKGGTGKTTVTFNFARELTKRGYKVLLIDLDGQGNLTKLANIANNNDIDTLQETISTSMLNIIRNEEVKIPLYKTYIDELDIIPCNIQMADTKAEITMALSRETILKRVINKIKALEFYDYILIDNAPSIEIDFINSLVGSDELVIISSSDTFSAEGIYNLLKKYMLIKNHFNEKLKISGILINNADLRTNFTKDMIKIITNHFKDINVFSNIIPASIKVKEATAMNKAIYDYDKDNKVSIAFSSFTDEYLNL